jgi:two-component system heavy metal sensor histidine kinase CusS
MLLKSAKQFIRKKTSLTFQLTLYFAIAAFVLLALVSVFFYSEMVNILHQNDKQFVMDEATIISSLLNDSEDNMSTLRHEVQHVPKVLHKSTYHYLVRVTDSDNQLLIESHGTPSALQLPEFFKTPAAVQPEFLYWYNTDGKKYLLMKFSTPGASVAHKVWQIQIALDVSYHHIWIKQHESILVMLLLGGEIFAILFGYFVARNGLRRMRDLMQTTKRITSKSLHQRIDARLWPKELRELGLSFNDMLNRIEQAFEHLTQFSADLAHELRTPVNNMLGMTELALAHHGDNAEISSVLESNLEELQRITKIIENILFLAHAENPQLDLKTQELSLESELAVVCDYYAAMAEDKNILLEITGTARVRANQLMLRRALSNIISNALKYSLTPSTLRITLKDAGHNVELILQDHGIGIAPEYLPKLFNRFYRVQTPVALQQMGNGLGLAIVHSIMKLHNGAIHIASKVGHGTCVTLRFPACV